MLYLQTSEMSNVQSLRPSKLIWQLPYNERQSFMENQFEHQFNEVQRMSKLIGQHGGLHIGKEQSAEFDKASPNDPDFEEIDDFIEEDEELSGASKAIKLSIRALNFNMMFALNNNH